MKAIITKFHGPSHARGSRFSADDGDGNRITISADLALSHEDRHHAAAIALCKKMGWSGPLMCGGTKIGGKSVNVYVFDSKYNRVEVV